jgi:hypothetical protein
MEVFRESLKLSILGRTRILAKDVVIREIIDKLIPTPSPRLRRTRRLIGVGHSVQGSRCLIGVGSGADYHPRAGGIEERRTCGQTAAVLMAREVRFPA